MFSIPLGTHKKVITSRVIRADLSTCVDYQLRCYPSGEYDLDFDGLKGPLPTVRGYCDMSTTPPTTIVHVDQEAEYKVQGYYHIRTYEREINYQLPYEVREVIITHT